MSWTILGLLAAILATFVAALGIRRRELAEMGHRQDELESAKQRGSHAARLQYPQVDLAKCIGCGSCVRACPEEGVLELIHGQAIVVHGARCVGHGRCAEECPTAGIVVRLGDLEDRRDIPALTATLESTRTPGLFLAGEVTGFALVRTAIGHGQGVAQEVGRRKHGATPSEAAAAAGLDLLVVGAGPAGLACALEAKTQGLDHLLVDQEQLGGTVAHYPRRKLVLTQPVELPRYGKLGRTSYFKEELIELWNEIVRKEQLPLRTGLVLEDVVAKDGGFAVHFQGGEVLHARNVCLALGRRGTPRKLGVPGEEATKVSYGLVDAEGYRDQDLLVVGGGDSAIEAAVGLAEQPGNRVTLSYRRGGFFRIKARNEARLAQAVEQGRVTVLFHSQVTRIDATSVELTVAEREGAEPEPRVLPNDEVFVLAGGIPPFELLERSGVSFDPADRPDLVADEDTGGLLRALAVALTGALLALGWAFLFRGYYGLPGERRPLHELHDWLSPSGHVGLALGIAAVVLVLVNLAYLLRKAHWFPLRWGNLQLWMTGHVATGTLALVLATLHGAMAPRQTVGGHAFVGLVVLVLSGAIGRYFYSFVPHAANGRDL
ncbi:MAG: NAD(P)-binding domain-containing protein, partial [Planctomycetota bacterium]|nr:NAD(P)-binding domain-containing protein [Planctomycetota bacterium]